MYDEAVKKFWPCHLHQFRRQEAQEDWHGQNVRIEVKMSGLRCSGKSVKFTDSSSASSKCQDSGEIVRIEVLLLLLLLLFCWKELHTSVKISVSIYAIALNSQKRCVCVWEGGYFLWFSQSQFHPHQFYGSYSLSACKKSQLSPWPCPSSWSSWRQGWWRCEG